MMPEFPAEIGGKILHKILPRLSGENKSRDRSFATLKSGRESGAHLNQVSALSEQCRLG
jgi:hypothetical protein